MSKYDYLIDESCEGERLDKGLALLTGDDLSRSFLQKLIKENKVLVNNRPQKSSYILKADDNVEFETGECTIPEIVPEDMELDILYEDNDVIVVNKPKGIVVHPAPGHYSGTLVNGLMYHCRDSLSGINGVLRPGIVHRIDKDTTGSVIACKNDKAHEAIAEQLKQHNINRRYRAIVEGVLKNDEYIIDKPIGRDQNDRKRMSCASKNSKRAVTHVKVLARSNEYTYIECMLETGRTHQIRVHMADMGHPILGDEVYGRRKSRFRTDGQCLHAYILGFIHPTSGEYIETMAPLPGYFQDLLVKLSLIQ